MNAARIVLVLLLLTLPSSAWALPSQEALADYERARDLLDEDPEQSYALVSKMPRLTPADEIRLDLLVEAAMRTQRIREAIDALALQADATPDATEAFQARLERAELLALIGEAADARAAIRELEKAKKKVRGRSADRRYLYSRIARLEHDLAVAEKDRSGARAEAKALLIHYPTEHATRRPGLVISPDDLSDGDRYVRAGNLMNSWGYEDARVEFERLRDHKKYRKAARWNLGLIGLRKLRDRPEEAIELFRGLADEGYREEAALWYLARAYMKLNRYDEAMKVFDEIERKFKRTRYASDIMYYRGWLPYDARENDKAIEGLEAFVDRYGRRARKSSYIYGFLAWAYMREKRWEEAIEVWDSMMPFGNTLVEGKALYWKAYALRELGKKDDALKTLDALRDEYPITYYGYLGEQLRNEIQGKSTKAADVWWPEGGGTLDDSPRMDVQKVKFTGLSSKERETWERVQIFAMAGEKHLAREELDSIRDDLLDEIDADKKDEWVHALGWFVGDYNKMWRRATGGSISTPPGDPAPRDLESAMAYPRAYLDIVTEVTDEFELPPYLVWAIMRQESRYKPGAISYTDAVGALQMIPKTARLVAADLGVVYDIRTFFRPEVGFRFSGYYMRKLLDVFDGLYVPMASAYNTGPGPIARWFRKNPEASFPWLIEEFEYNEGRAYCRKVAEHMLQYIFLYEPDEDRRNQILDAMFPQSRDIELPDDVGY